ncbi:MAG: tRNA (adenosine(37)-N6)-threonylcarbamoyltransferase complex ATPase subunit type 1 TsaE [Desulfovibrio sp.]|jgi:tRNA threonylcarbamoyladenosine biosynthesis protein TsaE|nr:tRNA (adenosine(37)-N6)-threonylcarbamoyltransferase complex ATPase subunit type 1 TsaE [Desulfovibrio sp.]
MTSGETGKIVRKMRVTLTCLDDTRRFGQALAAAAERCNPGALLLYGEPGVGKSTLAAMLTRALPGGEAAEPSSPSFTLCNIYCTVPEIRHFDLYRLPPGTAVDELAESFDNDAVMTLVEWPENIADCDRPADGVVVRLSGSGQNGPRSAELAALGPKGEMFLRPAPGMTAGNATTGSGTA